MKRNPAPSYLKHGQKDQARAVWTDSNGTRRFRLLPGKFNSPESLEAYGRLVAELAVSPWDGRGAALSELIDRVLEHNEEYASRLAAGMARQRQAAARNPAISAALIAARRERG